MDRHGNHLEAARTAWFRQSHEERAEALSCLRPSALRLADPEALGPVAFERLLATDPEIHVRLAGSSPEAHERLRRLLGRMADALGSGESEAGAGEHPAFVYACHLLALTLPLQGGDDFDGPLLRLLERAADHPALAPMARARASEQLADELLRAGGEELQRKVRRILADSRVEAPTEPWVPRPDRLLLSVDHTSVSCARYLAGVQKVARDSYGFDELRSGPAGRAKRVDQVTVKYDPPEALVSDGRQEALVAAAVGPGPKPGSELKAKLFVALLSLAASAAAGGRSDGRLSVRMRDLLGMLGFVLGRGTNSVYYWRYHQELVRYLLVDLPNRVVAMQVRFAGTAEPLVVFERLLPHSLPLDENREPVAGERLEQLLAALGSDSAGQSEAVRRAGLVGFELAFSPELIEALGLAKPMNAVEHVPVELLSLKGPAFWLAWQISFLRRWAKPPVDGSQGKPLLRVLAESGYLARFSRGAKVRYRDALVAWWRDVGELVGIGLLDEPGVRLYGRRGGGWRERSSAVSRSLDPGGGRLSKEALEELRVIFAVPSWRVGQLEEVRRRSRRLRAGGAGPG